MYLLQHGIPMFFVLIVLEFCWMQLVRPAQPPSKQTTFRVRLNDLVVCTALGSFQQVAQLGLELLGLAFATTAYESGFATKASASSTSLLACFNK